MKKEKKSQTKLRYSLSTFNFFQTNNTKKKFVLYYFIVFYCFRSTHNELEKNR